METMGGARRRTMGNPGSGIEKSPDRARLYIAPKTTKLKKVQVIYYLSRNGQLEHPHYMEVSLLSNQTLLLRDVMDKLSALRGKAMASLYSWSCKRTYKNGYVWNDLGENDVIYPAEGVEYILKGSEIVVVESAFSGELHKLELTTVSSRRAPKPPPQAVNEEEDADDDEEEVGEKTRSQCSRGVSTEEFVDDEHREPSHELIHLDGGEVIDVSPNLSFSSSSEKATTANMVITTDDTIPINNSKKLKSSISTLRAPSVLLQLIACGSSAAKSRSTRLLRPSFTSSSSSSFCNNANSGNENNGRKSLYKGTHVSRLGTTDDDPITDTINDDVIKCMAENPRFGDPKMKEQEYFSGSIVESMGGHSSAPAAAEPSLKISSSYNEERINFGDRGRIWEEEEEEEVEADKIESKSAKGKCIPGWK